MHVFIYAKYNFLFFPFEFGVKYELNMFLTNFVRINQTQLYMQYISLCVAACTYTYMFD